MTPKSAQLVHAEHATVSDVRESIEYAVRASGFSRSQLRSQAERKDFESGSARIAWALMSKFESA